MATQSQAERGFDQVVEWLEHFEELEDPRQSGKVAYPLEEMLPRRLLAVLAGAGSWVEIAEFGKKKLDFPRRFRAFERGALNEDAELFFTEQKACEFEDAVLMPSLDELFSSRLGSAAARPGSCEEKPAWRLNADRLSFMRTPVRRH